MRAKIVSLLIGLLFATGIMAQDMKKRSWKDGKLTWEDFTERNETMPVSELKYHLDIYTDKEKIEGATVIRNKAIAYIDKKFSWVNPEFKNEQYLRYNQIIFDIVEVHRRKLQYELDRVNFSYEIDKKFNDIYNSCDEEIGKFKSETSEGRFSRPFEYWEKITAEELQKDDYDKIPEFENKNFGYGLNVGLGGGFFTGSLGNHFTNPINFLFGGELAYKKSVFFIDATLGINKVKTAYASNYYWDKNMLTNVAILAITYGYPFIESKKIRLIPFAGFGVTEIATFKNENDINKYRFTDYNFVFGINTDFKLRTKISFIPDPILELKEKTIMAIRAKFYVTRANYFDNLNGYTINFALLYSEFGNGIKVKR